MIASSLTPCRFWNALAGAATLLAAAAASAEQPSPPAAASTTDIRNALIFTGHYSALESGQPVALLRKAAQSWQSAKQLPVTDALPTEEIDTLLTDGLKQRYAFGWAMLHDKSVGFDIGIPTKLVKLVGAHPTNAALEYSFEGEVDYKIFVRYGDFSCSTMNALYVRMLSATRPSYQARQDDWFAIATSFNGTVSYVKAICRPSAIAIASVTMPSEQFATRGVLLTAMSDSFALGRHFNPTAPPRPRVDDPPARPAGYQEGQTPHPPTPPELPPDVDGSGKTGALKFAARTGAELRAEQLFQQVSPAVYKVRADDAVGSAVAIGENELLTNCHVVRDTRHIVLMHDQQQLSAETKSMNVAGDRCILRTEAKLPKWVSIRSYDSIKIGERAFTIGTPRDLELTVAEGIVSAKRLMNDRRLVQTSAPISPGSSGGGLFDAEGHLLGITTFTRKDAQNLNFAIAAEEYAR